PALLMAALSVNLPAIFLPAGPMLRGNWQGKTLGSGSDAWKFWAERCAGNLSMEEWQGIEEGIARSPGHCMTMGTASTMTSLAETLGMTLPGAASIPAVDAAHSRMAAACGRRIVELVWEDWRPRELMTAAAFENAMTVTMAIGGSTNAIIHLLALAGRAKVPLSLARFDEVSRRTPMIANLRPSGQYLMEDFYYAGGLRAMLAELAPLLRLDCWTVNGRTLGENIRGAEVFNREVIRSLAAPIAPEGGTAILYGNLAPNGAVIKSTAASPELMVHTGRAVVFEDYRDLVARIDREDLAVDATSVLVLRRAGPLGGPGMPEWGMLPVPKKLLRAGVRDMVRVSDARMSGTSYGTCVLHVSPESFVGGPLALVEEGDWIELNVPERRLELRVETAELSRRRSQWVAPATSYPRGYGQLYASHVTQAHEGCDFDFLQAEGEIPDPDIH
ncbi:MAG: dihydroxy-acid dehydratase, partial [Blastocatellia bacterium]